MKTPNPFFLFLPTFLLFFSFFGNVNIYGQYRFDTWTTDNGLPQNGIRQITQTPDGYLWFTTFDGIVRFDGVKFTTFDKSNTKGIINNRFTGIYCDKDGTLYATTMENGVLTILKNGVFSSYTSEQVPGHYIQEILPDKNGELRFFVEDQDRLSKSWYYLRDGQFVFNEKLIRGNNSFEYVGKSGAKWLITGEKTTEIRNGKTTFYEYKAELYDFRNEILEDSTGGLWIGGLTLIHLKNGKTESFRENAGFPSRADFHSFREESDGSIWFANGGRSGSGVGLVRYKDGEFSKYGNESGLLGTAVFDVLKDREGIVWLATNKGLSRLRNKVIENIGTKEGLIDPEVYPIYRDSKENVWVGTTKGLSIYKNGKFEPVKLTHRKQEFEGNSKWEADKISVQSILEDSNGKMWIGANGGIIVAQNGVAEKLEAAEGQHVHAIVQDKAGNVWVATNRGILRFNDYKLTAFYSVKEGLPNEFMTTIFQDSKGRIWFGGFGGLSELHDGKLINFTSSEGLVGNYVRSIYEDKEGVLWIGTYDEGLSRFKDGKFSNFKAENGLYNNGVFAIQEDKYGNFWISSNRGIYRVKHQDLNDFAEGKIAKINSVGYGKEDGMLSTECNGGRQPASFIDKDGKFWFPTQDGVVVVNPDAENYKSLPPSVVIESVTVERENIDFRDGIKIEPGERNIEISYTGLSLLKSDQIKFKYKLEGHDEDWIDAGTRRSAYYSYLSPGNYKFQVIAATSDGTQNDIGTTIELEMKSFYYQTFWFQLLCVIGTIIVLLSIYKINVNRLEKREKLLTKLVLKRTKALKDANESLLLLANSDGLTSVGNRRRFEDFLADEWNRAVRFKTEISLIILDIDHFKLFNDTYGHQAGDECLKKVASALVDTIKRPTDLVARYGGEEFAIILGGTDSAGALNIAEQALENLKNLKIPHIKSKTNKYLTISIGVATTFAKLEMNEADLINAADKALYQAKKSGRNRINTFDLLTHISRNASVLEEEFINSN